MSRLGNGTQGMAQAIGIVTLAPGGTVAVPAALMFDEMEHYRAGIGCMLENTGNSEICVSVVVKGGAASQSGMCEGDIIESIDGRVTTENATVEQCSALIRGPSGSHVEVRED